MSIFKALGFGASIAALVLMPAVLAPALQGNVERPQLGSFAPTTTTTSTTLPPTTTSSTTTTIAAARTAIVKPTVVSVCAAASGKLVDVSIARQVLTECQDGQAIRTMHVSTGGEYYYYQDGQRNFAHTPRGNFAIQGKTPGWHQSPLGQMYYSNFFTGGYAIHGDSSVPNHPASHGCIRIAMGEAIPFYKWADVGTPVLVH